MTECEKEAEYLRGIFAGCTGCDYLRSTRHGVPYCGYYMSTGYRRDGDIASCTQKTTETNDIMKGYQEGQQKKPAGNETPASHT